MACDRITTYKSRLWFKARSVLAFKTAMVTLRSETLLCVQIMPHWSNGLSVCLVPISVHRFPNGKKTNDGVDNDRIGTWMAVSPKHCYTTLDDGDLPVFYKRKKFFAQADVTQV